MIFIEHWLYYLFNFGDRSLIILNLNNVYRVASNCLFQRNRIPFCRHTEQVDYQGRGELYLSFGVTTPLILIPKPKEIRLQEYPLVNEPTNSQILCRRGPHVYFTSNPAPSSKTTGSAIAVKMKSTQFPNKCEFISVWLTTLCSLFFLYCSLERWLLNLVLLNLMTELLAAPSPIGAIFYEWEEEEEEEKGFCVRGEWRISLVRRNITWGSVGSQQRDKDRHYYKKLSETHRNL